MIFLLSRSFKTLDRRIATMPGRSTSGFHRPGRHRVHHTRSAVGRGGGAGGRGGGDLIARVASATTAGGNGAGWGISGVGERIICYVSVLRVCCMCFFHVFFFFPILDSKFSLFFIFYFICSDERGRPPYIVLYACNIFK